MAETNGPSVASAFEIFKRFGVVSWRVSPNSERFLDSSTPASSSTFLRFYKRLHRSIMQVTGSFFFELPSCIGAAEGRGSSHGVAYSYMLSSYLWYGVYEVAVSVCAVRILIFVITAVARAPCCVRLGKSED